MSDNRFTFDTTILFYAADPDASGKHLRALALVEAARGRNCVLTLQSLGELFRAMLKRRRSAEQAEQVIRAYQKTFTIIPSAEVDLAIAIQAHREHNIPFWDAMLWATARRAGCTLLFTEDLQDGRTLGGVSFRNPFSLAEPELSKLLEQAP